MSLLAYHIIIISLFSFLYTLSYYCCSGLINLHFFMYTLLYYCCPGLYPHFRDFHTSLCGLLLVWTPLSSIRRFILGTRLKYALEFRVVEFSRVSDPLRRIQDL